MNTPSLAPGSRWTSVEQAEWELEYQADVEPARIYHRR